MGLISYPKMLEWNYHFILCKIPKRVQISEHVQLQRVLLSGECQMVEYKYVLWHYFRKYQVG